MDVGEETNFLTLHVAMHISPTRLSRLPCSTVVSIEQLDMYAPLLFL